MDEPDDPLTEHARPPAEEISVPPAMEAAVSAAPVDCPGCGAKLRNISAAPGVKIRCLNCGIRFVPFQSPKDALAGLSEQSGPEKGAVTIREPQSAGYWLLRIPAMVYALLISFAFASYAISIGYMWLFQSQNYYRGWLLQFVMMLLYLPLMPLSGYFFFATTRSFARLEARLLKAAWNEKLIQTALPAATESSLPYILPLAVGPTVICIATVVSVMNLDRYRSYDSIVFAAIASVGCFMLAFMIDDLRQFLWRQKALATACAQNGGVHRDTPPDAPFPALGAFPAFALISFALMIAGFLINELINNQSKRYSAHTLWAVAILTLFGAALTSFLMGRNFKNTTQAWWRACSGGTGFIQNERHSADQPARIVRGALYTFAIVGSVTMFSQAFLKHNMRSGEGVSFFCALCGGNLVCLTLAEIHAEVRNWRRAQTIFWRFRNNLTASVALPKLSRIIVSGTIALALIQSLYFICVIYYETMSWARSRWEWEEFMAIPLCAFAIHFPIIWVALVSREFLIAEEMAAQLKPGPGESKVEARINEVAPAAP